MYTITVGPVLIILMVFELSSSCVVVYPDIFDIENYTECVETPKNSFCMVNIELTLKQSENLDTNYNRSRLHRGVCVPAHLGEDSRRFYVADKLTSVLNSYNATITSLHCERNEGALTLPILVTSLSVVYLCLVAYCTYKDFYDYRHSKRKNREDFLYGLIQYCGILRMDNLTASWYQWISVIHNFRILIGRRDSDFKRLSSMQGLRTYHTFLVIACHCGFSWVYVYIKNPDYMEEIFQSLDVQLIGAHFMLVVQPFFVISAWIMTNKILEMHKKNGHFSLSDIASMVINRFIRFCPLLTVMILAVASYAPLLRKGPLNLELFSIVEGGCRRHWWATVLQIANVVPFNEMCHTGLWSISIDTQYYLLNMVMLYTILRFKWNFIKTLSSVTLFFYIRNVRMFYYNNFPALYKINLEGGKASVFFNNLALDQAYFGFLVNWGSSLIGILFGYLYYSRKDCEKIETWERSLVVVFLTLPGLTVFLGIVQFNELAAAIIGPLLKPLYGLGIASGIYVMSRGILRGFIANIFENNLVVFLGNFTFSTYIFHFAIVFLKHYRSTQLIEVDRVTMIISYLIDVILSFTLGTFMAVIFEQPGNNIKKMLLSQNTMEQSENNKKSQ